MATVNVYLRRGRMFVAPTDGVVDLEPVEVVEGESGLAAALERAFAVAVGATWQPRNLRDYKWPVLKLAGVRSALQFEKGMKLARLEHCDGSCSVQKYVPHPTDRGFVPDAVVFTVAEDAWEELAHRLVQAMRRASWPGR